MIVNMVDSYISNKYVAHSISGFRQNTFYSRRTYGRCPGQDSISSDAGICRLILVLFSSCLSVLVLQVNGCAVGAPCIRPPPPHTATLAADGTSE